MRVTAGFDSRSSSTGLIGQFADLVVVVVDCWGHSGEPEHQLCGDHLISETAQRFQHPAPTMASRARHRGAQYTGIRSRNAQVERMAASGILANSAINDTAFGLGPIRLASSDCCIHIFLRYSSHHFGRGLLRRRFRRCRLDEICLEMFQATVVPLRLKSLLDRKM